MHVSNDMTSHTHSRTRACAFAPAEHWTPEERRSLLKELQVMMLLQPHPNVIALLGCCTTSEPLCLIMEYAANGNLQELLRAQRTSFDMNDLDPAAARPQRLNLRVRDLTVFALHVASGMEYISSQKVSNLGCAQKNTANKLTFPHPSCSPRSHVCTGIYFAVREFIAF